MDEQTAKPTRQQRETAADRLRGILGPNSLSVDLVSAMAGDRELDSAEESFLTDLKANRGEEFSSDVLYALTYQHFAPPIARRLWDEILTHKSHMSDALGRNVKIVVATLDYLSNIRDELASTTLIGETHVANLAQRSMRDGLTGLYNHTTCLELLDVELKLYKRHGTVVSFVILDIDDFKEINDSHGHQEGDRVLARLAEVLTDEVREADICCRYGGEEFAVIMPFTDAATAGTIAERLRKTIKTGDLLDGGHLTVSFGVAACSEAIRSARLLVKNADDALYRAKRAGKDRVVIFESDAGNSDG